MNTCVDLLETSSDALSTGSRKRGSWLHAEHRSEDAGSGPLASFGTVRQMAFGDCAAIKKTVPTFDLSFSNGREGEFDVPM
jgi:hypothetical protein